MKEARSDGDSIDDLVSGPRHTLKQLLSKFDLTSRWMQAGNWATDAYNNDGDEDNDAYNDRISHEVTMQGRFFSLFHRSFFGTNSLTLLFFFFLFPIRTP